MKQTLESIRGQISIIDNMSVHAKTEAEHDRRLKEVLKELESAEATLYTGKCEFSKRELKFAGYVPNQDEKFAIGRGKIPSTS